MSISNLLTSGAQAGADLSITCHNVICDAESVFEAGLQTDTIAEYSEGAGVSIDGVLLKDGQVGGSLPYWRALKASDSMVSGTGGTTFTAYDSASVSGAGVFDTAAGTFTPTITGLYMVNAVFSTNAGGPSAGDMGFGIYQNYPNGARAQFMADSHYGGPTWPTANGLVWLIAGLPVSVLYFQTLVSPLAITNLEFTGVLVARA